MKQNPSDMEIDINNWEDNCIDVDEIVHRIVVKIKPLFKNYLLDLMSNNVLMIENLTLNS